METNESSSNPSNFILEAVAEDLKSGRYNYVRTRLPPEPNGYLHIGHVKAFLIDYNTAKTFNGELVLRFDDTNPAKEESEFVKAIEEDARWLGIHWVKVTFASDYFDRLYEWAVRLVKKGLAYVDDQTPEEMSVTRGTLPRGTKWSQTESAFSSCPTTRADRLRSACANEGGSASGRRSVWQHSSGAGLTRCTSRASSIAT